MSTVHVFRVQWHWALGNPAGPRHECIGQQIDNVGVGVLVDPVTGELRPDMAGIETALTNNGRGVAPTNYVRAVDSVSNTATGEALIPSGAHGELFPYRVMYRYMSAAGRPTAANDLLVDNVVCGYVLEPVTGIAHPDPVAVEAAQTQNGKVPAPGFSRVIENIVELSPASVLVA